MAEPQKEETFDDEFIVCRSYTAARRYPIVFGVIGGFVLPTPLSPAQAITFLASFIALFITRNLWGLFTPGNLNFLLLVGIPCVLTWAVRHLRLEGRSPIKTAIGVCNLWVSPSHGVLRGRPYRQSKPVRISQKIVIGPTKTAPAVETVVTSCDTSSRWSCLTPSIESSTA